MRRSLLATLIGATLLSAPTVAAAQAGDGRRASVAGRVTASESGEPLAGVAVSLEGTPVRVLTDSSGRYRILSLPAGPQVLRAQVLGYSPTRVNITIPPTGAITHDLQMARNALTLKGVQVNADPVGRARGEAGTATVIEEEAIRNQVAASLAGVLELVPGVPLQVPGLDNTQQVSLRSVPISSGGGSRARSAENLASFGTLIVLDGVPLSNNANLQSLGSRSALSFGSAAGGGVDLRRIPATTIERVEVIRGIPSARWGDLTHGAIIVDTRAGAVEPEGALRMDASTTEGSLVGGAAVGQRQTFTLTSNVARTQTATSSSQSTRVAGQLAHRLALGTGGLSSDGSATSDARITFDTRADMYRLVDDRPEVVTFPGRESYNRDAAVRLLERIRLRLAGDARLEWTTAYERGQQRAMSRGNVVTGTVPITNRTEPGRQVGRFIGGLYNASATVDGDPTFLYSRGEVSIPWEGVGLSHDVRFGAELRRDANGGDGIQFDIERPAYTSFNGVRGFDRPRAFSSIPPLATTGIYLDDRVSRAFGGMAFLAQGGLRLDLLHERGSPWSGVRDAVLQPRLNVELAPSGAVRFRAGAGRLAKSPALGDLYPALNYYDLINVNYFANDPAERLAVLSTFIFDPTNASLGYSYADRAEAGLELQVGGANVSFTAFADRTTGAVGTRPEPAFLLREHFDLMIVGPGRPPEIVEPASSADSVPVMIDRPSNNISQSGGGFELTADFPEIPALRTRVSLQGSFVRSRMEEEGLEFADGFADFQVSRNQLRSPYYENIVRTGERVLLNTRLVHHQPEIGLVVTGTIQHTLREARRNEGSTDSLAFIGYITRGGSLVPVAPEDRLRPEYSDLRARRSGVLGSTQRGPVDWMFNLQVSKTLPRDGRLSFYAFNAFDRTGNYGSLTVMPRVFVSTRFGAELTIPAGGLNPWR